MRTKNFKFFWLKPILVQKNQSKSLLTPFFLVAASPFSIFSLEIQGSAVIKRKSQIGEKVNLRSWMNPRMRIC
jgi:hypothetical protein